MTYATSVNDIWPPIFGMLILFILLGLSLRNVFRQSLPKVETLPKCVCGELATEPAPYLAWSRGALDWLRSIFAAPPRFKRVVDINVSPTLCRYHARVADAMLDEWVFKTRARYSELNSTVAVEAANLEQEALMKQISDALTENQKRATRKTASPIRVLPSAKTGTDDNISEG